MDLIASFQKLTAGDIFHASYPAINGEIGSAICLVTETDPRTVSARTVTTHWNLTFDRATLTGRAADRPTLFSVDSTRRLPPDVHDVMLEIDWKFDPSNPVQDARLTEAQMDALLFVDDYFGLSEKPK